MTSVAAGMVRRLPASVLRRVPVDLQADLRAWSGRCLPGDIGFEPVLPPVAHGERTGPPDFLVLGPAESGARWWLSQLADLPEVAPSRGADEAAHVFSRFCTDAFGDAQVARFHAGFPRRPGRVIGHWSADGLSYPWVAPLLARAAPRAQVIVLVRDPVELLADRLAATADTRPPGTGPNLADAVDRGWFGAQLTRLQELFPPDQMLVLQVERCVADTAGALARTAEFLGVGGSDRPVLPHPNAVGHGTPGMPLAPEVRARLRAMYADDVARLAELLPDLDLALWPNFAPPD